LEFSESHIIGTYKKNIYYNAFETQNCKLILNCYKILYILDLKTHRIESIKLLQKDEVLKSIRSLPSDKILGIGLSGRLSIIDLQTKKIDSIESPYFTSAIKIAVIKDQKILILKNTKDYNIQLLVNLNFTDSTINILKNLANMFDARKQYNAG
jgi:hypothetical protein